MKILRLQWDVRLLVKRERAWEEIEKFQDDEVKGKNAVEKNQTGNKIH